MQIVIEIPDGYVKVVMANQRAEGTAMDKLLRQAVIDGEPFPKGHGDLKDMNDLCYKSHYGCKGNCDYLHVCNLYKSPTIIEADKDREERTKGRK